jgi:gamma-glutamyltranspeptidase/glutathione hydrolase
MKTPDDPKDPLLNQGPKGEAVGEKVMVSTQSVTVTEAALQVLKEGGNAVDAFITSVFLQHVTEFNQVLHFGSMAGMYYEASTGKYYHFNATADRPLENRGKHGDPTKVAIGGTIRGLEELMKRFGTRSWADYIEPAIAAAEKGVLVTTFMYGHNYNEFMEGGRPDKGDLTQNEEAREFYMPNGHLVPVGYRWKMPALAEHLHKLSSEGADYMYTGEWGQKFIKEANKRGGRVTMEDMAEYKVRWSEPLRFIYREHEIFIEPLPVYGGMIVGYNLNILENFDLKNMGHYVESPYTLEIMARTFGRVSSEVGWLRDPLNFHVPKSLLLSKEYGKMGAEFVRKTMPLPNVDLSPGEQTEVTVEGGNEESLFAGSQRENYVSFGSCATVIVDAEGNWITALHTGHGGTPGVFIDGVRAVGSSLRTCTTGPGRRVLFPSIATILAKDGKPWMALGSPGSPPQPATEVLVNIIDFGMHPKNAADAVRFWAFRRSDRVIRIESRISKRLRKEMAKRGIKIKDLTDYNWHTGSFQIVWRDEKTGKLHGATDPRRLGYANGF